MREIFSLLRYGAAGSTLVAGILHLSLVANAIDRNFNTGILFLIGGLTQVFWVVPTIRGWNRLWYYVGIGGTLMFMLIWVITRFPGNPINGRGGSIGETAIAVEVFQVAFIVLCIIILAKDPKLRK
jgi:VIT1/CCC1 family predicted Fe2+/Mn2+ transporter